MNAHTPEDGATHMALTPEQQRRFTEAAEAPLRVRRAALLLASHASGHRKVVHGDTCETCREEYPCVAVLRAAGPVLDAVAALPSQHDVGREWASVRRSTLAMIPIDTDFKRGYCAALEDVANLAGQTNGDPAFVPFGKADDPDRCPTCRHRAHSEWCPNMASDNDCSCTTVSPRNRDGVDK